LALQFYQSMKTGSSNIKAHGFTLVELLAVICVIAILAAILLPATSHPYSAKLPACINNQRQIVLEMTIWNDDHGKQFSWEVSSTNSGTKEFAERGYAAPNFQILSNYINDPRTFICPTDKVKTASTNGATFNNQNVSYFLDIDAGTNMAQSILSGDRHLAMNRKPVKMGLMIYSNDAKMNWTKELHDTSKTPQGVISFRDGHVDRIADANLNLVFQREGLSTNRFDVP